jgi:outer membrane receptor protein involved in Fe transport
MTESQVAENRTQNHYNIKLGFDWYPTPNQTFTFFGLYDYELHIDTTRVWYFADKKYASPIRKWSFYENESTGFANLTLQHRYQFEQPGHELKSQLLFTKGWEDETYNLYQDGPLPAFPVINTDKTHVLAPEYIWLLNTDYIRPLPFGRLETGAQVRLRHMPITYTMTKNLANTALIYDYGDWSKWDENLLSLYSNLVAEFKKFDIEAGFRAEYVAVEYSFAPNKYFKDDKYDYFNIFPNVRFTFKPNNNNRISLFYNRRIDRPGEDILRIFPKYDDPELLKIGNPHLRPEYTQNIEIAHRLTWSTGSLYTALYFKDIDAYFTRVYIQDPDHSEITVKAYDNLGRSTNSGLEIAFDQKVSSFWNLSGSINVYNNTFFAHSGTIEFPKPQNYAIEKRSDTPMFAKLNNRLHLTWAIEMELI